MKQEEDALTIKRILVALDASPHSQAALQAAVELAVRFEAEVAGLFVEDENLLRLAELPFVREVGLFTATRREVGGSDMQRQIRIQSRTVRRVFTGTTERAQVRWRFRVTRGTVLSEVLAAASEADVLVLGRSGSSVLRRGRLGSTVRGILPEHFGLALVVQEGSLPRAPYAIVYDGSAVADRALQVAQTLNRRVDDSQTLVVILLAPDSGAARELQNRAAERLKESNGNTRFRWLTQASAFQLADVLLSEGCGTVILPTHSETLRSDLLEAFLENLELPVLLVT